MPVPDEAAIDKLLRSAYDLGETSCRLVKHGVNATYQVETGGTSYFLRVYRPGRRTEADVAFELALIRHLGARHVPAAQPVPRRDGGFTSQFGESLVVLFEQAPGRPVPTDADLSRRLGRAAAALHNATVEFAGPPGRAPLDLAHLVDQSMAYIEPRLPAATALGRRVKAALPPGLQWGACHGDLFRGNCRLTEDGTLTLFDFDECGMGYRAYDLAVYLWTMRREQQESLFAPFLQGYCELRPLPDADRAALPSLAAARQVWFMGQLLGPLAHLVGPQGWSTDELEQQLAVLTAALDSFS